MEGFPIDNTVGLWPCILTLRGPVRTCTLCEDQDNLYHLVEPAKTHNQGVHHSGLWDWRDICCLDLEPHLPTILSLLILKIEAKENSSNTLLVLYVLWLQEKPQSGFRIYGAE